jgi:hypothetical protein
VTTVYAILAIVCGVIAVAGMAFAWWQNRQPGD